MTSCSQCRREYVPRSYPRFLRSKRDKAWAEEYQKRIDTVTVAGKARLVTWVERLFCDCGWRAQLRAVDVQLLEQLLPDFDTQQEIRRRAA